MPFLLFCLVPTWSEGNMQKKSIKDVANFFCREPTIFDPRVPEAWKPPTVDYLH